VLQKRPLARVLADYDLSAGRVWVLFLLWLLIAPWLFFVLRRD
jgi:thiosulfate reductase cytochrome b subunit